MLTASIFRCLRDAAARLGIANQGNVAVIFAIAALPVLTFVGAAIDYSRANAARSSMQAALDSTALMLWKDLPSGFITNTSAASLTAQAQAYFTALSTDPDAKANANSPTTAPVIN